MFSGLSECPFFYRICTQTKKTIRQKQFSHTDSYKTENAKENSLFHTVGYKNHSVGYKFHTVKQRLCKGISRNMQQRMKKDNVSISILTVMEKDSKKKSRNLKRLQLEDFISFSPKGRILYHWVCKPARCFRFLSLFLLFSDNQQKSHPVSSTRDGE